MHALNLKQNNSNRTMSQKQKQNLYHIKFFYFIKNNNDAEYNVIGH